MSKVRADQRWQRLTDQILLAVLCKVGELEPDDPEQYTKQDIAYVKVLEDVYTAILGLMSKKAREAQMGVKVLLGKEDYSI